MGGLKKIIGGGAPKTPQSVVDAERRAKEAEAKAAAADAQSIVDTDYRKRTQRGKVSTILTKPTAEAGTQTRSLLGG